MASPWSEDAARQVGAAPAAGRRRARAPRAASRAEIYIHKFSHFRVREWARRILRAKKQAPQDLIIHPEQRPPTARADGWQSFALL